MELYNKIDEDISATNVKNWNLEDVEKEKEHAFIGSILLFIHTKCKYKIRKNRHNKVRGKKNKIMLFFLEHPLGFILVIMYYFVVVCWEKTLLIKNFDINVVFFSFFTK